MISAPRPMLRLALPVVLFFLGGGRAVLSRFVSLWKPVFVVIADVASELPDIALVRRSCPNVKLITLGEGHTTDSFVEHSAHDTRTIVRRHAGTLAVHGLGQVRIMGHLAAEATVSTEEYASLREEVVDELKIACAGVVPGALFAVHRGVAGATGSGAIAIAEDLALYTANVLGVPIQLRDTVVGAVTYTGLGSRLMRNTACALVERCDDLISKDGSRLVSRELVAAEYPPYGRDRASRDAIISLHEQAAASSEFQDLLNREAPNNTFNGPWGAVQLHQISCFDSLDFGIVANEVADSVGTQIEALLRRDRPDRSRSVAINFRADHSLGSRESVEDIAVWAASRPFAEVHDAVTEEDADLVFYAVARLETGDDVELAQAATYFAEPPRTPEAATERLVLQSTCIDRLEDRAADLEQARDEQRLRVHDAKQKLRPQHRRLRPSLTGLFSPNGAQHRAFERAATALRVAVDALREIEAKLDSVAIAHEAVSMERKSLRDHLSGISQALDTLRPRRIRDSTDRHVNVNCIERCWADLWALSCLPPSEQQGVIAAAVSSVTAAGLARVVGATAPRLDAVCRRIAFGRFAIEGPPWAGKPSTGGRTVFALPPMECDDREKLARMLKEALPAADVVFTDTAACGVNVLRCRLSGIDKLSELIAGDLQHHLQKCLAPDAAPIFLVRGPERLSRLGIEAHNGELHFRDLPTFESEDH